MEWKIIWSRGLWWSGVVESERGLIRPQDNPDRQGPENALCAPPVQSLVRLHLHHTHVLPETARPRFAMNDNEKILLLITFEGIHRILSRGLVESYAEKLPSTTPAIMKVIRSMFIVLFRKSHAKTLLRNIEGQK